MSTTVRCPPHAAPPPPPRRSLTRRLRCTQWTPPGRARLCWPVRAPLPWGGPAGAPPSWQCPAACHLRGHHMYRRGSRKGKHCAWAGRSGWCVNMVISRRVTGNTAQHSTARTSKADDVVHALVRQLAQQLGTCAAAALPAELNHNCAAANGTSRRAAGFAT